MHNTGNCTGHGARILSLGARASVPGAICSAIAPNSHPCSVLIMIRVGSSFVIVEWVHSFRFTSIHRKQGDKGGGWPPRFLDVKTF